MEYLFGGAGLVTFLGLLLKLVLVMSGQTKSEREGRKADRENFEIERTAAVSALAAANQRTEVERTRADRAEQREDDERKLRIDAENKQAETNAEMVKIRGELTAVKEELARLTERLNAMNTAGGTHA